jgi:hypothetical protein
VPRVSGSHFFDSIQKNKSLSIGFVMGMRSRASGLKALSTVAMLSTFAFLIGMLVYLSIESFRIDTWLGFRSVVASILPILAMVYLSHFTRIFQSGHPNPQVNVFIIYGIWTLMLLILDRSWDFGTVPVMELLISATFASIFWRSNKQTASSSIFACCYGVLVGLFTFVCFFRVGPVG